MLYAIKRLALGLSLMRLEDRLDNPIGSLSGGQSAAEMLRRLYV